MPEQLQQQNLSGTFIYNKYLIKQLEKNKPEGGHMHPQIIKELAITPYYEPLTIKLVCEEEQVLRNRKIQNGETWINTFPMEVQGILALTFQYLSLLLPEE